LFPWFSRVTGLKTKELHLASHSGIFASKNRKSAIKLYTSLPLPDTMAPNASDNAHLRFCPSSGALGSGSSCLRRAGVSLCARSLAGGYFLTGSPAGSVTCRAVGDRVPQSGRQFRFESSSCRVVERLPAV